MPQAGHKSLILRIGLFLTMLILALLALYSYNLINSRSVFESSRGVLYLHHWDGTQDASLEGRWPIEVKQHLHPLTFSEDSLGHMKQHIDIPGTASQIPADIERGPTTLVLGVRLPHTGRYTLSLPDWNMPYSLWIDKKRLLHNESVYDLNSSPENTAAQELSFEANAQSILLILHTRALQDQVLWPPPALAAYDTPSFDSRWIWGALLIIASLLLILFSTGSKTQGIALSALALLSLLDWKSYLTSYIAFLSLLIVISNLVFLLSYHLINQRPQLNKWNTILVFIISSASIVSVYIAPDNIAISKAALLLFWVFYIAWYSIKPGALNCWYYVFSFILLSVLSHQLLLADARIDGLTNGECIAIYALSAFLYILLPGKRASSNQGD